MPSAVALLVVLAWPLAQAVPDLRQLTKKADGVYSTAMRNNQNLQYFMEVTAGTPGQTLHLAIATTIADVMMNKKTSKLFLKDVPGYDLAASTTGHDLHQQVGDHPTGCFWMRDVLGVAGLQIPNYTFIEASWTNVTEKSWRFLLGMPQVPFQGDGMIGMAFDPYRHKAPSGYTSFPTAVQRLYDSGDLKEPVFSIYFATDAPGEFMLGGANHDLYVGDFNYVKTIRPYTEGPTWVMPLSQVKSGDKVLNLSVESCVFEVTSVVCVPNPEFQQMVKQYNGTNKDRLLVVPCSADVTMTFTIDGQDYSVGMNELRFEESDGQCTLAIANSNAPNGMVWSLGAPFMRKYYTKFDVGQQRMGIARAIEPPARRSSRGQRSVVEGRMGALAAQMKVLSTGQGVETSKPPRQAAALAQAALLVSFVLVASMALRLRTSFGNGYGRLGEEDRSRALQTEL